MKFELSWKYRLKDHHSHKEVYRRGRRDDERQKEERRRRREKRIWRRRTEEEEKEEADFQPVIRRIHKGERIMGFTTFLKNHNL